MSCCDGATVKINAESPVDLTVQSFNADNGSIQGLSDGTESPPVITFSVQSGFGTQGKATGTVVLVDGNGQTVTLDYVFLPSSFTGSCPCNPSGRYSQTGGGYTVGIIPTSGSSAGSAVLQFNITK